MNLRKATLINFVGKYSNVIIQLIINSILARLLSPEDFGIVAILTVFTNFFTVLSDMGISTGIIQRKDLNDEDNNTIFSFTVYLGIILSIIFCCLSVPISILYENRKLLFLCIFLSPSILFNTLNMVPNAILLKKQLFAAIAIRTIFINIIVGIITVILAFVGLKYYALIINSILISFFTFIFTFIKTQLKFKIRFSKSALYKIKDLSSYQFAFSFVNYFSRNLDNMLTGKFFGETVLGYYDKAYKLMTYPNTMLTGVISSALHPILSEYQSFPNLIYQKYVQILNGILSVGTPISVICFVCAKEIIVILYGSQWSDSIIILQLLSLSVLVQLCMSTSGAIFQSLGNTKLLFKTGLLNSLVLVRCMGISLIFKNVVYLGLFVSIGYNLTFFFTYFSLVKFGFKKSILSFFKSIGYYFGVYFLLLIVSMFLINYEPYNIFFNMILKCIIIIFLYALLLFLNKNIRKQLVFNIKEVKKKIWKKFVR